MSLNTSGNNSARQADPNLKSSLYGDVQDIQKLSLRPSLFQTVMMLPFPTFCVGCCACCSMTSNLSFDNIAQILTLQTYPGYMCCLSEQVSIPYSDIETVSITVQKKIKADKNPASYISLITKNKDYPLTAPRDSSRTMEDRSDVMGKLKKCNIVQQ